MWQELKIKTTNQAFPAASNLLEQACAQGICKEELYPTDLDNNQIIIKAYFESEQLENNKLEEIKGQIIGLKDYGLETGELEIDLAVVKEEDWANNWKENFKPFKATDKLVIKPTWEEYQIDNDELVIEIDPGQAFGTGQHETTISVLALLEKNLKSELNILDVGTGTGILSIAAAKLGANDITAIDIDSTAVKVAQENAKLNGVAEKIEFLQGDLVEQIDQQYNLVIANILPDIIKKLIPNLNKVCELKARVILSGIIRDKEAEIRAELKKYNFLVEEVVYKGDWVSIAAIKQSGVEQL